MYTDVVFWLSSYYKIFLLDPTDVPYVTNKVRKEDVRTREKFHVAFLALFAEKQIEYELLSGALKNRIQRVDEILATPYQQNKS